MSGHCPWHNLALHRYSNSTDCYIQHMYDDTYLHIFKNVLYSTDPTEGCPLTRSLVGVDEVKMLEFGLNHRVCNVEATITEPEIHVLEFRPNSATELWTLVRNVYNKWERLYEDNERMYWPCKSQAVDLIVGNGFDVLRCLQPVRFVTDKHKLAQALLELLSVLTSNYFYNLLEKHESGEYVLEISRQKVRKIECNAFDKATAFFREYDPDRLDEAKKGPHSFVHTCIVKRLMDTVVNRDCYRTPTNILRKLFHYAISDVFTGHREHVHMLLCHRFLTEDRTHCEWWLRLALAVADSRLQMDDAQNRLIAEVKLWKRKYDFKGRERRRAAKRKRLGIPETV